MPKVGTYLGKPCRHGHGQLRYRSGGSCVTCVKQKSRDRFAAGKKIYKYDAADRRARNLKRNYNLTPEQYDLMVVAQDGCCAICTAPSGEKKFHVDHDHATGQVRSLLCQKCNVGLGVFDDAPERLEKAAAYIRTYSLRR